MKAKYSPHYQAEFSNCYEWPHYSRAFKMFPWVSAVLINSWGIFTSICTTGPERKNDLSGKIHRFLSCLETPVPFLFYIKQTLNAKWLYFGDTV